MSLQLELSNNVFDTITTNINTIETLTSTSKIQITTSMTTSADIISSISEIVTEQLAPTSSHIDTTITSSTAYLSSIDVTSTQATTTPSPTPVVPSK